MDSSTAPTINYAATLNELIEGAFHIMEQSDLQHRPGLRTVLFSGGDDSAVVAHLAKRKYGDIICLHLDTGVGLQATRDHVENLKDLLGINLQVYSALENTRADGTPDPQVYAEHVRMWGFPGRGAHSRWAVARYKQRSISRFRRDHEAQNPIAYLTGIRAEESTNRKFLAETKGPIEAKGNEIYVNPIMFWPDTKKYEYLDRFGIPRNPVKAQLCSISGDCLCGAMGSWQEWEMISAIFPDDPTVIMIEGLRQEMRDRGIDTDWSEPPPPGTFPDYEPLVDEIDDLPFIEKTFCNSCIRRAEMDDAIRESGVLNVATPVETLDITPTAYQAPMIPTGTLQAGLTLPAILGRQSDRYFFVTTLTFGTIAKYLTPSDPNLPPEERAQRLLEEARSKKIAAYIETNRRNYVIPSLFLVIEGGRQWRFNTFGPDAKMGYLSIEADKDFPLIVLDGQHRQDGCVRYIGRKSLDQDEEVAVEVHVIPDLETQQRYFADINSNAKNVSSSIQVLYNHDDHIALATKAAIAANRTVKVLTDLENTKPQAKSIKLFTLNKLERVSRRLLAKVPKQSLEQKTKLVAMFLNALDENIPEWRELSYGRGNAREIRQEKVHHLQVILEALAIVVSEMAGVGGVQNWPERMSRIKNLDWHRAGDDWQDLIYVVGAGNSKRISNANPQVQATADYFRNILKARG